MLISCKPTLNAYRKSHAVHRMPLVGKHDLEKISHHMSAVVCSHAYFCWVLKPTELTKDRPYDANSAEWFTEFCNTSKFI